MKAAVLHATGDTKLDVRDDVTVVDPGPNDVRVAMRAAGVCHSDISAMSGVLPQPPPCVLGHEGAGEVIEVGSAVTDLAVGDHVIVNWTPSCGTCKFCAAGQPNLCMVYVMRSFMNPQFALGDTKLYGMSGAGTFAEQTVLPQQGAVKVDADIPFEIASLIGCGVMTGAGAAINAAAVTPGSSVVVVGCGGVGVSVIQGARICGASVIVGIDMVDQKLQWAKDFGATHTATPDQLPGLVQELTAGDGFDYGFEVVGRSQTIRSTYDATRRGGTVIVVGAGSMTDMVSFNAFELFFLEKTLKGTYYGSAHVRRDYARLLGLWRAGKLDLERMISRRITLDDINDGLEMLQGGEVLRQIVQFS